ncbi:glycosyltransferase family 32 protein [Lapidilactobacillus dextrinicus]|uniref:glycosyltransferase family 32 protein n=1 Tax=Lapidilactobacillus dextrinicus TaxID=51664 RepID=UPI003F1FE94A
MIPKTIHYCWFGGSPLPSNVKKCIDSWKKYCPDYKIIQWNESNFDIHINQYVYEAYKEKKYAFVSDFARLQIVYDQGGIYLDTDVELLRPLDDVLDNYCFMALEQQDRVATGLGFGGIAGASFLKANINEYKDEHFIIGKSLNYSTCVEYTMKAIERVYGSLDPVLFRNSKLANTLVVYPQEYFCPYDLKTKRTTITQSTIAIHHYDASWYSQNKIMIRIRKMLIPVKIYIHQIVDTIFGRGTYDKIKQYARRR